MSKGCDGMKTGTCHTLHMHTCLDHAAYHHSYRTLSMMFTMLRHEFSARLFFLTRGDALWVHEPRDIVSTNDG